MLQIILTLLLSSINLGALGSVVLWRNLVNIGDTISHAIILCLVAEYFFSIPTAIGAIIISIIFIILIGLFSNENSNQNISMIIFSGVSVAITVLVSDMTNGELKIRDFVVGDVLSSGVTEVITSVVMLIFISYFLYRYYKELIIISISSEVAIIHGIKTNYINFIVNLILAISISISIQLVGVLLMTSFLVIPASIARIYSVSPWQMILLSSSISAACSLLAILLSIYYDIGFSPVVILILACVYLCSFCIKNMRDT